MKNLKVSTPSIDGVHDITHQQMYSLCIACGLNMYYPKPFKDIREIMQFADTPAESIKGIDLFEQPDDYRETYRRILLRMFLKKCAIIRTNSGRIVGYDPIGRFDEIIAAVCSEEVFNCEKTLELEQIALHVCWIAYWKCIDWEVGPGPRVYDIPKCTQSILNGTFGTKVFDYMYTVSLDWMLDHDPYQDSSHDGYEYISRRYSRHRNMCITKLERVLRRSFYEHFPQSPLKKYSGVYIKCPEDETSKYKRVNTYVLWALNNHGDLLGQSKYHHDHVKDVRIRIDRQSKPDDYLMYVDAGDTSEYITTIVLRTLSNGDYQLNATRISVNTCMPSRHDTSLILPKQFSMEYLRTTAHPNQLTDSDVETVHILANDLTAYHEYIMGIPYGLKKLERM